MAKVDILKSPKNERRVRDVLSVSGTIINIFEPSENDVNKILELQEKWVKSETEGVSIDGADIVKELFPLLTDIEGIEDLTDEEIKAIVNEPSLAFLQAQYAIEIIIGEIFSTLVLSQRKALSNAHADFALNQSNQEMFDRVVSLAAKSSSVEDVTERIENQVEELMKVNNEAKEKVLELQIEESKSALSAQQNILNAYLESFSDKEKVVPFKSE
ncbi:hypothetical protein JXA27_06925 [Aerococcaceae bacterium zg-B36]|uniref:hypothetical protein n=1 Tax=Aerococcaceae bacterium zg-252 TaxID=2796928 RepID=UPI001BD8B822|nr:hypothetical protein [Aerococcaceae bacterium zg-B36]